MFTWERSRIVVSGLFLASANTMIHSSSTVYFHIPFLLFPHPVNNSYFLFCSLCSDPGSIPFLQFNFPIQFRLRYQIPLKAIQFQFWWWQFHSNSNSNTATGYAHGSYLKMSSTFLTTEPAIIIRRWNNSRILPQRSCVDLHVQKWMRKNWDGYECGIALNPGMSELPPTPEALLKVVRCRLIPVDMIVTHEGALGQFRGDRRTVWTLVFGVNKIWCITVS